MDIMWDIEKIVKKGDYLYAVVRGHPSATLHGYVLMHRIVMENHLNRLLAADEVVHHIDNDKHNNAIENLRIMSVEEHTRLHNTKYAGGHFTTLICFTCGKEFDRSYRNRPSVKHNARSFCSRSCYYVGVSAPPSKR